MIANENEYNCVLEELRSLEELLAKMRQETREYRPDLELLSVRRLIARLHEELGQYEARADRPVPNARSEQRAVALMSE